jgi:hypothetical protein
MPIPGLSRSFRDGWPPYLKHVQIPIEEKFYETLFSNESAVTSKNKALIHDYINENVTEHKSKRVKK